MDLQRYPLEAENEQGLLTRLSEECSEVILAACKAKRFGLGNFHPITKIGNVTALRDELMDVTLITDEMRRRGLL